MPRHDVAWVLVAAIGFACGGTDKATEEECRAMRDEWGLIANESRACVRDNECSVVGGTDAYTCNCAPAIGYYTVVNGATYASNGGGGRSGSGWSASGAWST